MIEQPTDSSTSSPLALTFDNVLRTLTCASCNKPFDHPVTLDCGNTLCLSCLPKAVDDTTSHICTTAHCNPGACSLQITHVDVTLAKLTKLCLNEVEYSHLDTKEDESNQTTKISGKAVDTAETRFSRLHDMLSLEFECQICYQVFHEPVTTVCGHTFCHDCLLRTYDHCSRCPMCRHQLTYDEISQSSINFTLSRLVDLCLPEVVLARRLQLDQEFSDSNNEIPLFVCSLVFPGMPCQLHIFEPRYRLMVRRSMKSGSREFGMLLPGKHGKPFVEYGTMVRIESIDSLPDGRSLVQTVGLYRFRVKDHSSHDGYFTGRVERIMDDPPVKDAIPKPLPPAARDGSSNAEPENTNNITIESMMEAVKVFINSLRNGSAPWLLQRLDTTYGAMPNQPEAFSYWAASVIPIEEYEKYKLLTTTSTERRLKMIVHWVDLFKEQWWFSCGGCATM